MVNIIAFSSSIILSIITIGMPLFALVPSATDALFVFIPMMFLYMGLVFSVLSCFSALQNVNLLVFQWILFIISIFFFGGKSLTSAALLKNKLQKSLQTIKSRDSLDVVLLFSLVVMIVLSFIVRLHTPINDFDDKMYRGSAPLYWLQNKSVFRYQTHNPRQNLLAMGTGELFLWPQIFSIEEKITSIFYWTGYPLILLSLLFFTRKFHASFSTRIFTALLFAVTPIIHLYFSQTLVQESWLTLAIISYAYFMIRLTQHDSQNHLYVVFMGLCLAVAIFIKPTGFAFIIPGVLYISILPRKKRNILGFIFGLTVGLVLTGYVHFMIQNIVLYKHPFGPPDFRIVHQPDKSLQQIATYIKRMPFIFIDPPVFSKQVANSIETAIGDIAINIGVTYPLSVEERRGNWVGQYNYRLQWPNNRFGLGGVLWLSSIIIAIGMLFKKNTKPSISRFRKIFLLFMASFMIIIFEIRWAEHSSIPYRHLLSVYGLFCAFFPIFIDAWKKTLGRTLAGIGIMWVLFVVAAYVLFYGQQHDRNNSRPQELVNQTMHDRLSPYFAFLSNLETPTSFLLVGPQDAQDYPLFLFDGKVRNAVYIASVIPDGDNLNGIISRMGKNNIENLVVYSEFQDLIFNLKTSSHFAVESVLYDDQAG